MAGEPALSDQAQHGAGGGGDPQMGLDTPKSVCTELGRDDAK